VGIRTAVTASAIAAALVLGLAGCSTSTGYNRTDAKADVAKWLHNVESSADSGQATPRSDTFITCNADHAYFVTTWQWRTVAQLTVPKAKQDAALADIRSAFESSHWTASTSGEGLTLTGPATKDGRGQILVAPDDADAVVTISVTSACYS
jgi:hypothetical protein